MTPPPKNDSSPQETKKAELKEVSILLPTSPQSASLSSPDAESVSTVHRATGKMQRSNSFHHEQSKNVRETKRSLMPVNFSHDSLSTLVSKSGRHESRLSRRGSHQSSLHSAGSKAHHRKTLSLYSHPHTPIVREKEDLHALNAVRDFFTKSCSSVAHQMGVNLNSGLKPEDISIRKEVFGLNELKKEKGVSFFRLFLSHLVGVLNFILLAASIASVVAAILENSFDWIEGVLILFIIVANTLIGFTQEYRSAKTMQSLMQMFAPEADVMREGTIQSIPAKNLVPGDVVLLEDGDFVPADLRLVEAVNLHVDEAFLTGESDPVSKSTLPLKAEEATALGDRSNMAYMSSIVTGGRGKGIVVRTGEDTELGEIAKKLRSTKDQKKTELQKSMSTLGLTLFLAAVAFSFLVIAIQVLAIGTDAFGEKGTWLYVVALCVAIIPEGLPAVLALTLAIGMRNMAKKNAIVRKLGVLESLNWITDICTDKTGTLTEGKMVATCLWTEGSSFSVSGSGIIPEGQIANARTGAPVNVSSLSEDRALTHLLRACALCNMATITKIGDEWQATSSPTEIALQVLATKMGMGKPELEKDFQFIGEHPFDSNWKRMSVVYTRTPEPVDENEIESLEPSSIFLFMKGSVESVLPCCSTIYNENGDRVPLSEDTMKNVHEEAEKLAQNGLRVLVLAMKDNFHFTVDQNRQRTDEASTFLGLVGISDPPRPQSKPAVDLASQAGINVYMLTGDHKKTAQNIAKQCGIITELQDVCMLGSEFERQKVIGNQFPKVVARCNPNTKIRMIEELHERNRFVAMTGDGVNDAPAIKKSDVGIAMGLNGSEVTKDSADIVLLDDNFGTILVAIEEGRRIFSNIHKIVLFLMTNNVAELLILVLGLGFSFFDQARDSIVYPLTPMQILWLNVITDTPVCIALGLEPASPDVMKQKPRSQNEGLFNLEMNIDVFFYGFIVGVFALSNFAITFFSTDPDIVIDVFGEKINEGLYSSRAVCFFTICFCMLAHGLNCLHQRNSIMLHKFEKKWILVMLLAGSISMLFTVYIPWINVFIFKQYYLDWYHWIQVCLAVGFFLILSELYKLSKKGIISFFRSSRHLILLAERTSRSIANIDAKMGDGQMERLNDDDLAMV